ncbi:hypothetical protein KPB1_5487 [Klebsiella pneumoniae Kb140]|nr:hypothetical protein KPB1_5487 [Klebsiella pneumoniae Kb140]
MVYVIARFRTQKRCSPAIRGFANSRLVKK